MNLPARALAYAEAYAKFPASHLHVVYEHGHPVLYGIWLIGNNYRATGSIFGSYPPGYLKRVHAIFPDVRPGRRSVLHVFSGSLNASRRYARCDLVRPAEYPCSVLDLPARARGRRWPLVLADPPYSKDDAAKYGTPTIHRGRTLAALAAVTTPGGFLCWLDAVWPMFRKDTWRTVGRIGVVRSTNHRVRLLSIFQRIS